MKKNILKSVVALMIIFSLTGCTKYIKDEKKQILKNEKNGQNVVDNILCQPTDKDLLKIYDQYNKKAKKSNKINIDDLPKCENLKVTGGKYEGIWTTVFVKPLAWFIIKIGNLVRNYGLGLILATILIRLVVYPFTKKAALQSEMLKKAQPELEKLEKKYKDKNDQESMMKKSQEMLIIYKKYNINPMAGCLFSLIQLPLFFAFYEAISRIPALFEENFLGFQLGTSPAIAVFSQGKYYYLIFIVLIFFATYFSFKLNSGASMSKEQEKSMKIMSNFMVVFMTIVSFSISSGIAIYWITSNVFTIIQNLIVKKERK